MFRCIPLGFGRHSSMLGQGGQLSTQTSALPHPQIYSKQQHIGAKRSVLYPSKSLKCVFSPLGSSQLFPRPSSWLVRVHPSPYPTLDSPAFGARYSTQRLG